MTGIDGIAATLDKLDDMEAELRLDDGRHLAGFECKSCRLKFGYHLSTGEEAQFSTFASRSGILRIECGKHRKTLAFEHALAQFGKLGTHAVALLFGDDRLDDYLRNLIFLRHHGKAVGRQFVEELGNLGRSNLDVLGDLVFHIAAEKVSTNHVVVLFFQLVVGESRGLSQCLLGAVLQEVAVEVIVKILLYLFFLYLNAVHFALVHQQLGEDEVFQNGATRGLRVGHTRMHTHLRQRTFNI